MHCCFCDSTALRLTHGGVSHPKKCDHGPFDLYECAVCGSVATWPPPSSASLAALYGSFASGVEGKLRDLRQATPLTAWFDYVRRRTAKLAGHSQDSRFRWIDVGAGGGELAALMAEGFPNAEGVAIDWATRPAGLDAGVEWLVRDLNATPRRAESPAAAARSSTAHVPTDVPGPWGGVTDETDVHRANDAGGRSGDVIAGRDAARPDDSRHARGESSAGGFADGIAPADLVISLSVWEHVLDPAAYVRGLLTLVAPGGLLYLVCPDAGSLAFRVLRSRWPYFLPGEHLHMPTAEGARRCIERAAPGSEITIGAVGLPYPPSYVLGFLGLDRLSRWMRSVPAVPLPVGALETVCRRNRI